MKINCVWEHNGNDTLLYAANVPGVSARGESREIAMAKMAWETQSFLSWQGKSATGIFELELVQEKESELQICDADSDVLFDSEREPLTLAEYAELKALVLKSAEDFQRLYEAIPDKNKSDLPVRRTFYGPVPRTAEEMYCHTKSVNSYYFVEIGVDADNEGSILECRARGFEMLEQQRGFLKNTVMEGSYGEQWSLRKVLRRFLWHDRIHAKAMYRMARRTFGSGSVPDVFCFGE